MAGWQASRGNARDLHACTPVGSTSQRSVQASGTDLAPARHGASIRFLFVRPALCLRFLHIPPCDGHPCRSANFPLPGVLRTCTSKWVRPAGRTNKKGAALRRPSRPDRSHGLYCQSSPLDFFSAPARVLMVSMMAFGRIEMRINCPMPTSGKARAIRKRPCGALTVLSTT